jgi:hypothetical protein
MNYPSEGQITFVPLLIVDWSMEHSHRRTAVSDDGVETPDPAPKAGAAPVRVLGDLFAKALAPLRVIGAR